jgi:hypothetical protein
MGMARSRRPRGTRHRAQLSRPPISAAERRETALVVGDAPVEVANKTVDARP